MPTYRFCLRNCKNAETHAYHELSDKQAARTLAADTLRKAAVDAILKGRLDLSSKILVFDATGFQVDAIALHDLVRVIDPDDEAPQGS